MKALLKVCVLTTIFCIGCLTVCADYTYVYKDKDDSLVGDVVVLSTAGAIIGNQSDRSAEGALIGAAIPVAERVLKWIFSGNQRQDPVQKIVYVKEDPRRDVYQDRRYQQEQRDVQEVIYVEQAPRRVVLRPDYNYGYGRGRTIYRGSGDIGVVRVRIRITEGGRYRHDRW